MIEDLGPQGDPLAQVISYYEHVIDEARRGVSPADIRQAIELLATAERIVAFGLSKNRVVADYLVQRLRRISCQAMLLGSTSAALVEDLMQIKRGDALVAIAAEHNDTELELVLHYAREQHAPSVLVSENLALALRGRYSVALSVRAGSDLAPTQAGNLLVVDTLVLGIAARHHTQAVAAHERLVDLSARLTRE